ncbi:MAG: DUF2510 domain-containing protein [Actinomycetota bacterium]
MNEFLTSLGPEARERPDPTVKGAIVAAAALLAWIGSIIIAADNLEFDETNVIGIALGLACVGAGYVILMMLEDGVRPSGIALIALGTAATVAWVFDDISTPTAALLVFTVAYLGQWAFGPAKGAMAMLTLGLFAAWALFIDLVAGDPEPDPFNQSGGALNLDDTIVTVPDNSFLSGDDTVSYLSLLIGAALLFGVRALDRRGWHGVATSAVIVGDIAFVIGVFGVVGTFSSDEAGSLLVLAAGVVIAICAAPGGRRFSAWLGGIGVFIGLIAFLIAVVEPDSAVQFGLICILIGTAIIAGAAFIDIRSLGAAQSAGSVPPTSSLPAPEPSPTSEPDAPEAAWSAPAAAVGESMPASPPVPEPEPAPTVEAGWHPDPSGGHELRYHDGTDWTAHVSDGGVQSTDGGI